MIKTLNNTIKQDRTAYKIPRSVQDVIPIQRIFADGIFQFGTKYSRTLRFSDINYAIASKEDKTAMFLGYSELLNALDSGSTTKLTICNKQVNRQAFEDTVLLPQRGDSLDGFVDEFNGMLEGKISGSSASVEQERFITVSVHKKNVDEARTFFSRVTGEVSSKLSRLNSSSNELDAAERLDVLRGFFRPEEAALPFDLQSAMKRGHNLKDTICPDSLEFHRDYFKMGSQYGRVLFLKDYASYIKDSMILELTDLNRRMMLSIDMIPVPTDEAVREVENKLLGVETNVTNWQRRQNSNQNFSAVVPYDLEQQRKETREMLDDLTTRDQRMLFAVVTLVHLADSKEELDSDTETLQSIARKHLCQLAKLSFQQQDGLITALPLGLRRIDALRTERQKPSRCLCHSRRRKFGTYTAFTTGRTPFPRISFWQTEKSCSTAMASSSASPAPVSPLPPSARSRRLRCPRTTTLSSSTLKPSTVRWSKAWAARSLKSPRPRPIISTPSIWSPATTTATIPSC